MTDNTNDLMAPDASPSTVSKTSGVRRVNNRPMYILGGVLAAFLLTMMMVAADRAAKEKAPAQAKVEKAGSTAMFAKEITGDHADGIIQAATTPTPSSSLTPPTGTAVPIATPTDLDAPPTPPHNGSDNNAAQQMEELRRSRIAQQQDEAQRIRMAKLQMLEEAIRAKTGVQVVAPRSGEPSHSISATSGTSDAPQTREQMIARLEQVRQEIAAANGGDPSTAYKARLAQINRMIGSGDNAGSNNSTSTASSDKGYSQFDNGTKTDRWQLNSKVEAPRSPYELRAGFVVPALLISGINSELPGQIMAQVSQNVYDSATGNHLLIPQGSRLVGAYASDVAYGQARVLVAWQRIVFPDGKAMDIGSMPGADGAGYSGFHDQVNNHYLRVFASAFLMSGVTAGIAYSQDKNNSGTLYQSPTMSSEMSQALGQQLGQVTAQLIAKNMNIAPTLEIRPGYRFNVIVTKDMVFSKPYREFDY